MKKRRPEKQNYERARLSHLHRKAARAALRRRYLARLHHSERNDKMGRHSRVGTHRLRAPVHFSFIENFAASNNYIEEIRLHSLDKDKKIYVDLSRCASIGPEAVLVLAAELKRIKSLKGEDAVTGCFPRLRNLELLMHTLGFPPHLDIANPPPNNSGRARPKHATILRIRSGALGEGHHGDAIRDEITANAATIEPDLENKILAALNEALENVVAHAYCNLNELDYKPLGKGHWWISGYRDSHREELHFMVYDQGESIPSTFPKSRVGQLRQHFENALQGIFTIDRNCTRDAQILNAAVELGGSSSKLPHRGRGLLTMRHLAQVAGGASSLYILSRRGLFKFEADRGTEAELLPSSLKGTLVCWRIAGSPKVAWEHEEDVV